MAKHNPNPISYFDLVSCVCSARTPKTDRPGGWAQLPTATEPSPRPPARRRSPRRPVRRATMSREGPRIGVRVDYHRSVWLPDLTTAWEEHDPVFVEREEPTHVLYRLGEAGSCTSAPVG